MIAVDSREPPKIFHIFDKLNIPYERKTLQVGDIVDSEKSVAIERKTMGDFSMSIMDGRIFKQVEEMQKNFDTHYIIISGAIKDLYFMTKNLSPSQRPNTNYILGAMASLVAKYKVPILMVDNDSQLVKLSAYIIEKTGQVPHRKPILKAPRTPEDVMLNIVASAPLVGLEKARLILAKFSTINNICASSTEELMQIDGVGKVLANNIKKYF